MIDAVGTAGDARASARPRTQGQGRFSSARGRLRRRRAGVGRASVGIGVVKAGLLSGATVEALIDFVLELGQGPRSSCPVAQARRLRRRLDGPRAMGTLGTVEGSGSAGSGLLSGGDVVGSAAGIDAVLQSGKAKAAAPTEHSFIQQTPERGIAQEGAYSVLPGTVVGPGSCRRAVSSGVRHVARRLSSKASATDGARAASALAHRPRPGPPTRAEAAR